MADRDNKKGYKGKHFDPSHDPKQYFAEKAKGKKGGAPQAPKQPPTRAATIPGPSKASNTQIANNPTPQRNDSLCKDAIFTPEIYVKENNMRKEFQPSVIRLTDLTEQVWNELSVDNPQIDKQMLIEGFRYYTSALFWIRAVQLKKANNYTLTDNEVRLLSIFDGTVLNIPEPIMLYLNGFGTIEDVGTGQQLIATFPALPDIPVNGFGGYWGQIGAQNHALYEDYPNLGVMAEGLRQALSDAGPGIYVSAIAPEDLTPNGNLQGFRSLVNRRGEAKNLFLTKGITADAFPESVPNTAFNYGLITAISAWVGTSSTFKTTGSDLTKSSKTGINAQLVCAKPVVSLMGAASVCRAADVAAHSLEKCSANTFGVAIFGLYQLFKKARPGEANLSIRSQSWCCINFTGANAATTIPQARVNGRNARRNLPPEFLADRFSTVSLPAGDILIRMIQRMVIAKRYSRIC